MATDNKKAVESAGEQLSVKIVIDRNEIKESVYSNHVIFNVNPLDAALVFCEIDTDRDKPTKKHDYIEIKARPKVRIVLPRDVFLNLADLMTAHVEKLKLKKDED